MRLYRNYHLHKAIYKTAYVRFCHEKHGIAHLEIIRGTEEGEEEKKKKKNVWNNEIVLSVISCNSIRTAVWGSCN